MPGLVSLLGIKHTARLLIICFCLCLNKNLWSTYTKIVGGFIHLMSYQTGIGIEHISHELISKDKKRHDTYRSDIFCTLGEIEKLNFVL